MAGTIGENSISLGALKELDNVLGLMIDRAKSEKSTSHLAVIKKFDQDGLAWGSIVGSEIEETPIEVLGSTVAVDDIVNVEIEDGVAKVSSSGDSPAVSIDYFNAVLQAMVNGDVSSGYLADATNLAAVQTMAVLKSFFNITANGGLQGRFEDLYADNITAKKLAVEKMEAVRAYIHEAVIDEATIDKLRANEATLVNLIASEATIEDLIANKASIETLNVKNFNALRAYIHEAIIDEALVEKLTAKHIRVTDLIGDNADIEDMILHGTGIMGMITVNHEEVERLIAGEVTITDLVATKLHVGNLEADFADIKLAHVKAAEVGLAKMQELVAETGWFTQNVSITGDVSVTGQLKSVLIDGDSAHIRNIYADSLKILGLDGLYHRLNFLNYDETPASYQSVTPIGSESPREFGWYETNSDGTYIRSMDTVVDDTKQYYSGVGYSESATQVLADSYGEALDTALHGSHIIAETITADKLDATSIRSRFLETDKVVIGAPGEMHIEIVNNQLRFLQGSEEPAAYITVDNSGFSVMYITRSVVVEDMYFGDSKWKFYKRSNNNMSVKWTG